MKNVKTFDEHLDEGKSNSQTVTLTAGIRGESGNQLFALIVIDEDDSEDTTIEFWRANSEEELYDAVKADFLGIDDSSEDDDENDDESDDYEEEGLSKFDEDWGFKILPKLIGRI